MVLEALETYYQNETSLRQCVSARDHLHIALGLEQSADFKPAQKIYEDLAAHSGRTIEGRLAAVRLPDLNELIAEKETYRRIHANAVRVLTDIGMNIAAHEELINILMEAEAIDLDNTEANLVPLKADYIQRCLDLVPRWFPGDPGRNAFGTGGTPPFFRVNGEDSLRPAARDEFKEIVRIAALWSGLISMFSIPVRSEKDMSDHECALTMERGFPGLKMTATCQMSDREAAHLSGRSDWLDGTSLMCNLAPMGNMIGPFIRSAGLGNNMLLLDMAIAGASGPNTPEALLTHIHAQILFMMVLVQTIRPGTICIHGGMPSVSDSGGDLSYSSPLQPLINAAMARLNLWVTGLPSAQSGGSTSVKDNVPAAVAESAASRNRMRDYSVHMVRHALGAMGNLMYFDLNKFQADCRRERASRKAAGYRRAETVVRPLYLPEDPQALNGIREMADKGGPGFTDHTLRNVNAFTEWSERMARMEVIPIRRHKTYGRVWLAD